MHVSATRFCPRALVLGHEQPSPSTFTVCLPMDPPTLGPRGSSHHTGASRGLRLNERLPLQQTFQLSGPQIYRNCFQGLLRGHVPSLPATPIREASNSALLPSLGLSPVSSSPSTFCLFKLKDIHDVQHRPRVSPEVWLLRKLSGL